MIGIINFDTEEEDDIMVLLFDSAKDMQHFLNFVQQELSVRKIKEGRFVPSYSPDALPCEINCQIFKLSFCVKEDMSFIFWDILIKHKKRFPRIKYVIGEYK